MTVFLGLVTWASSGLTHCGVTICSCKWLHWFNFTFACLPPGAHLGCHLSECRVWIACYVMLNCCCSFLSVLPKSMMMTNIFPSAEVSHFLKWLKNKDWCDVCVREISTAGLNSIILPPRISLQSLTLSSSKDQILQSHSTVTIHLKHKQRQSIGLCEWGRLN